MKTLISNKHAKRNYHILEVFEAGMLLSGTEVKSISKSQASINEAYVTIDNNNEAWILNMHVSPFFEGNMQNKDPYRNRKLLLHKKEITKLAFQAQKERLTIVPIKIYWKNNYIKIQIGLAQGKKLHDKRADLKARDQEMQMRKEL